MDLVDSQKRETKLDSKEKGRLKRLLLVTIFLTSLELGFVVAGFILLAV